MTKPYSIAEARRRGWLPKQPETSEEALQKKLQKKSVDIESNEVARLVAKERLIQKLLEADVRLRIEHRFHPTRRWRFDLALLDLKVALEIDGFGPGHYSIKGRAQDNEKDAAARGLGWHVFHVSWKQVKSGEALAMLLREAREARDA